MPSVTGQSIIVPAGSNLQSAIDSANLGDEIVLQAGATYGAIRLRNKSGSGWLVIRSSAASQLPAGTRVKPADAGKMARIVGGAGSAAAVQTDMGAHHYRFIGIEFTTTPGAYSTGLIRFGAGETSLSQLPHSLIIDRCYVHGDAGVGGRRGVALNSGATAIIDSYFSDWKGVGEDTQAIGGWNGSGPFKIVNNYLEGAAENIMFGGADPTISNLIPSDIEIRRNHFFKPTAWRSQNWSVKNLFELKSAQRVLIDGNIFENSWAAAQNGTAVLFSIRNQSGGAPWNVIRDITFTNNTVKHVASGLKVVGFDDVYPTQQTTRVLIKNNVFDDVNHNTWGGDGRMFLVLHGPDSVTIDHNTGMATGAFVIADNNERFTNFVFTNNIATKGLYGVKGDALGEGLSTLTNLFPGYVFSRIALIGASASIYPPDNFFPTSVSAVQFVDPANGNFRLAASSPYVNAATDGSALGANMDVLQAAQAGSGSSGGSTPTPTPEPTPTPTPTPPSLAFTNPASGATVSGTVTVSLSASGGSGSGYTYTVKAGTATIYSGTNGSFSWNTTTTANGGVTLAATVTDSAGGAASATRNVTVSNTTSGTGGSTDTVPPTVAITAPQSGVWTGNSITVSAQASDNVGLTKIELWGAGAAFATLPCSTTTCSGTGGWYTGPLPKGAYIVNAVAYDRAGNRTTSAPITINKDATSPIVPSGAPSSSTAPAPTPLSVSFTSPASGATVSGSVTVSMAAAGGSGSGYAYTVKVGTTTIYSGATTSFTWNTTTTPNGGQTLTATVTDSAGASASTSRSVTVSNTTSGSTGSTGGSGNRDTVPPTVSITSPTSGVWTGNSIVISAAGSDNKKLSKIELWGNGRVIGTIGCSRTTCSGSVGWFTGPLAPAAYEVKAVAIDAAGNRGVSAGVIINKDATSPLIASGATGGTTTTLTSVTSGSTLDTTAPTVRITSPPNGAWTGNSIGVSAAASDNVAVKTIELYGDGSLFGTINCSTASCTGTVWWVTGGLPNGTHLISAVARDTVGNATTSSTVTIYK
jgi:hypothetical protein